MMAQWYAKKYGAYNRTDSEAENNAVMIYNALSARGWLINPICAVLGNMEVESGYNPKATSPQGCKGLMQMADVSLLIQWGRGMD